MKKSNMLLTLVCFLVFSVLYAQTSKQFELQSPDGAITISIEARAKLQWSVKHKGQQIILPSSISLQLEGKILGDNLMVKSSKKEEIRTEFNAIN